MFTPKDVEDFLTKVQGATEDTAMYYLEMCGGKLEEAMNLYFDLNGRNEELLGGDPAVGAAAAVNGAYGEPLPAGMGEEDLVRAPDQHFHQALIHDMDESNFLFHPHARNENKLDLGNDTFGKLFEPPADLVCHLPFEEARKKARQENKYLLVNIQNSEFRSVKLNRDIWKNEIIQEIVKNFFLLWVRNEHDPEAAMFMHAYKVTALPYISVLCKRTGRQLKIWNTKKFEDCMCAQSELCEFIESIEMKSESERTNRTSSLSDGRNASTANSASKVSEAQTLESVESAVPRNQPPQPAGQQKVEAKEQERNVGPVQKKETAVPGQTQEIGKNQEEYNRINNELSELHKLRLQRMKK